MVLSVRKMNCVKGALRRQQNELLVKVAQTRMQAQEQGAMKMTRRKEMPKKMRRLMLQNEQDQSATSLLMEPVDRAAKRRART
jgi:hypothetical protein